MAKYTVTTTLTMTPTGGVLDANGSHTTNIQIDSVALLAAQQAVAAGLPGKLPTGGNYTYNPDGTIATDPDGNSYTYNANGTLHTVTNGGVTRTYAYNPDGTIASVA